MIHKVPKIFLLLSVVFLAASCVKDIEPLMKNPYWIHGDFNPTLGVPVAYGEMNVADLLHMMKEQPANFSVTYDEATDLVMLNYDSSFYNRVDIDQNKDRRHIAQRNITKKGRKNVISQDFKFKGAMSIGLFNDISELPDSNQLKLQNVFLTLQCHISADMNENTAEAINRYGVGFNLAYASVVGIDGNGDTIPISETLENVSLDGLADGDTVSKYLFNKSDVANIINSRISQIFYSVALRVSLPDTSVMSVSQFIKDSVGIHAFDINSDISLNFPVSGYINGLGYNTDIAMNTGNMDTYGISIDTAQLVLDLENALPVELRIQGTMIDSAGNVLCNVFPLVAEDTIPAARVAWNSGTNSYVSAQSTSRTHYITLNQERFEALRKCRTLRLSTYISTSHHSTENRRLQQEMVTLRGSDKLKARAYILAKPHLSIDTVIASGKSSKR